MIVGNLIFGYGLQSVLERDWDAIKDPDELDDPLSNYPFKIQLAQKKDPKSFNTTLKIWISITVRNAREKSHLEFCGKTKFSI
jgi:hypothetical protein